MGHHPIRKRISSFLLVALLIPLAVSAQIKPLYHVYYRPVSVDYRVLERGPFQIIYQEGMRDQAIETLWTLETSLPGAESLLGTSGKISLPVILNNFSDDAGGYVSTLPFKTEIEGVSLTGKSIARRHRSWTEIVVSHELVHAVQGEFSSGFSTVGVVHVFAPDFARALNLFMPHGISEGLAVARESRISTGAGRANYPYFTMQYRAAADTRSRMTLARTLEATWFTRPYSNFYQGGTHLVQFMMDEYGENSIHRLMKWQQQVPFLGFGVGLKAATGDWPWIVGRKVREQYAREDSLRLDKLGPLTEAEALIQTTGRVNRRPRWLSRNELVVFSLAYNMDRGFYRINVNSGEEHVVSRQEINEDAEFSISPNGMELLFSRYVPDKLSPVRTIAHGFAIDLKNGIISRIPDSEDTLNPVRLADGRLLALENQQQFNRIVEFMEDDSVVARTYYPRSNFQALAPRPHSDELTALLKAGPNQALYHVDTSQDIWTVQPWIGFENGSILDFSWSDDGRFVLFSADMTGVLNVYAFDTATDRIRRMTNVRYAAMEPDMAPGNERFAFAEYRDESFDLMAMPFDFEQGIPVDRDNARFTADSYEWEYWLTTDPTPKQEYVDLEDRPYDPLKRMAPRMIYPTFYLDRRRRSDTDARLGLGIGLAIQGADLLEKVAYHGEGVLQKQQLWGEVGVRTAVLPVITSARMYRRPDNVDAQFVDSTGARNRGRVIRDRAGVDIDLVLPVLLGRNVARSSFVVYAGLGRRTSRFVDDDFESLTSRVNRWTFLPSLYYGHRLKQDARNIIPKSGASIRWYAEYDLQAEGLYKNRGWILTGNIYLPFLNRWNTGIRLNGAFLRQNSPSIFNLDSFKPKGQESTFVSSGDHVRFGIDVTQPILFADDGFTIVPFFLSAVYLYGFAEHMTPIDTGGGTSSIGGGVGVLWRVFYNFNFEFRIGAAWLPDEGRFDRLLTWY